MKPAAILAVLACVTAAPAVQAQVYQCKDGGRMVFSDRPCGENAQPVKAMPASPQGAIEFEVPVRHYKVSAPTVQDARLTMRVKNPGGFAGWARWKVSYRYDQRETNGLCTITSVTVHVAGDIHMPEWVEERQAPPQEQAQWRAMYAALKRHEEGHVQHGREFALLLKERLLGLGTVPCTSLAERAQQEYTRLHGNLQRRDEEYDRRTDHGLRQDNPR